MSNFSENLKNLRNKKGIPQRTLAKDLNVSNGTIALWETDKRQPDYETAVKISEYFNVSINELLGKSNSSNFIPVSNDLIKIPILGSVTAGIGGHAEENIIGYELISASEINGHNKSEYFYLQVTGDSMSPEIKDGDLVLVQKISSVDSGTLAVVCIDDEEAVIKIVKYGKTWIELHSFNPYFPPRRFENADVERIFVIGKVKKSERKW